MSKKNSSSSPSAPRATKSNERRVDPDFQRLLHHNMEKHQELLRRLEDA